MQAPSHEDLTALEGILNEKRGMHRVTLTMGPEPKTKPKPKPKPTPKPKPKPKPKTKPKSNPPNP